ncbi:hypothetical protein BD626DRAFT_556353 [Schizophyllum amplum]|uniref:Uncharacterized protein n=1 Tax=Schizophyllum amplum TaxID=97359 RepID=A0A550CK45_9AGAR|nr:hypothetical protein BD626DRAFT_556353 [Auriculariopsis ampla]
MTRAARMASRTLSTSCHETRPRPTSPEDIESWIRDAPSSDDRYHALTLDDVYGYKFETNEQVWIRDPQGMWRLANITPKAPKAGPARYKDGLYYSAVLIDQERARKPCLYAPQNGDIKPDTPHIRRLLLEEGYLSLF